MLVAFVLVAGVLGAAFAWRQEQRGAEVREADAADGITAAARATAENAIAGLSGAAGLVGPDGDVDPAAFEAFRVDVSRASSLSRLALIPVVEADERADYEREWPQIIDLEEGFTRAAEREWYWPVARISPLESLTAPLLGADIASFPLTSSTARTARDSGDPRITEALIIDAQLVTSLPDPAAPVPDIPETEDEVSVFFILKPLYLPGGQADSVLARRSTHVGFVVSVYDGFSLRDGIREEQPEGVHFEVRDGDAVLARSGAEVDGGVQRTFEVGGRTWVVHVEDHRPTGHPLTLLILGITALIVGGLVYLIRRSDRYERDTSRAALLISRTGDLAQRLAVAATVDDVAAVIARDVPAIFGARAASLGLLDRDTGTVRVHHGPATPAHVSPRTPPRSLDDVGPLTEAVRSGELVLVQDHADWWTYAAGAGVHEDVAAGTLAAAGLPLDATDGTVTGAVAVLWDRRQTFDATTVATLRTVTELCEQSLHRARMTDQVSMRAAGLAELAEQLAATTSVEQATRVATTFALDPVGATAASVGIIDPDTGTLHVHHGSTVAEGLVRRYSDPPLDAELAVTEAARTGEPVLVPTYEDYVRRYPNTDAANAEIGEGARAALPLRADDRTVGSIVFSWAGNRHFDDTMLSTLSTIAEMVAQTVQRARLAEHLVAEARHSRDLAELAEGLASRAHTEDVTGFLASRVVTPLDAVHATVGIIREGVLHRHFSSDPPGTPGGLTESLSATPLDTSTPLTVAARTGEDVLIPGTAELRERYPDLLPLWDAAGFKATANLPLRDRTGKVIGALGIAWDHHVTFSKELRDRLTTIVGLASQTIERAQLADLLRDTARRNEQLADFAQHVAQARTVDDLCDAVVAHAGAPVDAAVANLAVFDEATQSLRLHPHPRFAGRAMRPFLTQALGARLPAAEAVRSQSPVVVATPEEVDERYPGNYGQVMRSSGLAAGVHLPVTAPGGSPLGAVEFWWSSPQQIGTASIATMRTIAELCAQTMERTRLGEAEHRLVASLQHRVVTPLPGVRGLGIAQRYRPAAHHVGMGGDWYDGITLPRGRYALVIGDISGHGITAVADMVQLRSIIQALVRGGVDLGEVFPRASALLQENDNGVTASAFIAIVDRSAQTISYISSGHPPSLLRTADGSVRVLEGGRQPLLGIPMPAGTPVTVDFPPGSILIAYTDGLIERRDEVIDASIERLRVAVRATDPTDIERMADRVLEQCLDGREPEDDVALVVVRNDHR